VQSHSNSYNNLVIVTATTINIFGCNLIVTATTIQILAVRLGGRGLHEDRGLQELQQLLCAKTSKHGCVPGQATWLCAKIKNMAWQLKSRREIYIIARTKSECKKGRPASTGERLVA
jgi:hypothetical protein